MYKIKQLPEDFIVDEVFTLPQNPGEYHYFLLKKTDLTTLEATRLLAKNLNISERLIKCSGNKDKHAVTSQVVSIGTCSRDILDDLHIEGIHLDYLGSFQEPVFIGWHDGNCFRITVRNIDCLPRIRDNIPNFFGEQRFSRHNVQIGRALMMKDFGSAARILEKSEPNVRQYLARNPTDFVGAIRMLPKSLIKIFLHSFQSLVWNNSVRLFLERRPDAVQTKVPIVGFATELGDDLLSACVKESLDKEKVSLRDFLIRSLPDLSPEGGFRELFIDVKSLVFGDLENDELNEAKKKCVVSFCLAKGCYATVVIDFLFKTVN